MHIQSQESDQQAWFAYVKVDPKVSSLLISVAPSTSGLRCIELRLCLFRWAPGIHLSHLQIAHSSRDCGLQPPFSGRLSSLFFYVEGVPFHSNHQAKGSILVPWPLDWVVATTLLTVLSFHSHDPSFPFPHKKS